MVKQKLNLVMNRIRETNPDATWANLVTGIVLLVLIAIFSLWRFGESVQTQEALLDSILETSSFDENSDLELNLFTSTTKVHAGESLWTVAERVCGDGEKYNILAKANDLTIWSSVRVDQELVIACE